MPFTNETDAITYVFESLAATDWRNRGLDEETRDPALTGQLLAVHDLPDPKLEYAVVTGSKGKGSITTITARLLRSLGHTVGTITSPHLTTYRQRFRVNGRMMDEATLVRHINELTPSIDRIRQSIGSGRYLSPQGIFLAMALRWFREMGVTVAVIEVGRGGRYDDNALVPNKLSLFGPIILEHTRYLGPTVDRIAWHKAGIIKPHSYAYSVAQSPEVMDVLRAEADHKDATFEWLAPADVGDYLGPTENGMRVAMGRYGEVNLPMLGRYEIENAGLAVWAAGNIHARLDTDIRHASAEYVARIREGLEAVQWPGRCQKLEDAPAVYVDGAINTLSAKIYIDSVRDRLTRPTVTVLAVPTDRDVAGVYSLFAPISDALILTQTGRNITIHFPQADEALATARRLHDDVTYADDVPAALALAKQRAGTEGTVLMALAQPAIGDLMAHYGLTFEQI